MDGWLSIDGSQGEGGGQILRSALTLSILTGTPVHITRIRAGRRSPGLAPQHLAGTIAAARLCGADLDGAFTRSGEIWFRPGGPAKPGEYKFDIGELAGTGSAGAVTLLLQSLLLPLALAAGSSTLTLKGGTHVAWSPPVHYLEWVLFPLLARMGLEASIDLRKWGWFPKGGGEVQVVVKGNSRLKGIDLRERGPLQSVKGVAGASSLPANIPQRIADRANNVLRSAGLPRGVEPVRTSERSTGAGIVLAAIYEHGAAGFTSLGTKGKPSELVANEAADALIAHHLGGYALDAHLPDQLLLPMAFAEGPSWMATAAVTRHTLTNAAVIGLFLDRPLTIEGQEGSPGLITVG